MPAAVPGATLIVSVKFAFVPLGTVCCSGLMPTVNSGSQFALSMDGVTVAGRSRRPARIAGEISLAVVVFFTTPPVAFAMAVAWPVWSSEPSPPVMLMATTRTPALCSAAMASLIV